MLTIGLTAVYLILILVIEVVQIIEMLFGVIIMIITVKMLDFVIAMSLLVF